MRLFRRDLAQPHQLREHLIGRRRKELRRHLNARHLGDDLVRSDSSALRVAANARHAVAHQWQREAQIGRGLDQADTAAQIERGDRRFKISLIRAMNQIEAVRHDHPVRPSAHRRRQLVNRRLDALQTQARRAEKTEHAGFAHRLNQRHRRNAVGHGASHVGIAQAVVGAKSGVAKIFRAKRRGGERQVGRHRADYKELLLY